MINPQQQAHTAALLLTALLFLQVPFAPAQRRRTAPRQPAGPVAPAQQRGGPARTETPATPQQPRADSSQQERRAPEPDRPLEELIGADAYGVYAEVRKVGALFGSAEVKAALGAAALVESGASDLLRLADFVTENAEALAEARVAVALLPTRADLPQPLVAVRLPSPEAARAFEPKFRALVAEQGQALAAAAGEPAAQPRARGAGRRRAAQPAPGVVIRRAGSWLLAADRPFTLRRLGGGAVGSLADSARFQNLRARFANDSVFVYFDTERVEKSWSWLAQQAQAGRAEGGAPEAEEGGRYGVVVPGAGVLAGLPEDGRSGDAARADEEPSPEETSGAEPETAAAAPPEVIAAREDAPEAQQGGEAGEAATGGEASTPARPDEAEAAMRGFGLLLGGLWGGVPRLPGAVAAGAAVEGGAVAFRVAVDDAGGGPTSLIPFLPNVVAGPPVTVETAAAVPSANEVFFATSLDLTRIFDILAGEARAGRAAEAAHALGEEGAQAPDAEAHFAAVEKLLGFRIRQDLLPALGNEFALSVPLSLLSGRGGVNSQTFKAAEGGEWGEGEAEQGFVAVLALNDPDAARRMIPKLSPLLGFGVGSTQAAERREGYEIRPLGSFSYAVVGRFLLIGDSTASVRFAVDSYARGETLANDEGYRDATAWQPRQRLAHLYVSDRLMAGAVRDARRMAEGSADPLVLSTLPQLDLRPEAVSFGTSDEGDVIVHELRLPVSLGRVYAAAAVISSREGANVGAEAAAAYTLKALYHAEESFRGKKDRGRYGTLEELVSEEVVDKGFAERDDYRIELTAYGDRFEATATPKEYGRKGRRSFYVDQTGVVRAADHRGRPATSLDPPVD